ncbi:MAG: Rrf2 family transcriptional regulator [Paracoccaceae bacterium]
MKLNTQGRYALIALVDLSSRSNKKNISLSEISERQKISLPYLEQLFLKLRKAGIVKSFRGASGGYAVAKSPDLLRVTEILKAVDQDLDLGSESNSILKKNKTNEEVLSNKMWEQLSANMYVFLHQMRLSDITADQLNPCPAVPNFITISDS